MEGPRDAVLRRSVSAEEPRDAVVSHERDRATLCDGGVFLQRTERRRGINGEGPRKVKIVTTPCRLLCHYLPAAQNFLATIWPLIEILRSFVNIYDL